MAYREKFDWKVKENESAGAMISSILNWLSEVISKSSRFNFVSLHVG